MFRHKFAILRDLHNKAVKAKHFSLGTTLAYLNT
jgi:hypothetical protein